MTEQAKIRRLQDTLTIAGSGVIAFGVWSLAKIGLFLMLASEETARGLLGLDNASLSGIDTATLTTLVYVTLGVIALIDLGVRAFVGLSARAEGRGKKKSPFYLFVALFIAVANAFALVTVGMSSASAMPLLDMIISIVIETTAIAALVLVIYSSIRLRRMNATAG